MKKILLTIAAAAVCTLIGCNQSFSDLKVEGASDTDVAFGDSLSEALGKDLGHNLGNALAKMEDPNFRSKFDKDRILEAIAFVLKNTADTADYSYMQGLQIGMQFAGQLSQYEVQGVPVSRNKFYTALKSAFKGDTIPDSLAMNYNQQANILSQRANELAQEKMMKKLEEDPKAIQNKKAGEAFLAKVKAENPDAKTLPGGTVVVTIQEGAGNVVTDNDLAEVAYKGTLEDGTSFDDSQGEARAFSPQGVVPGFGEALKTMKKGGKYKVYIPGPEGYGVQGVPEIGIGPNMALVFEVEVKNIKKAGE